MPKIINHEERRDHIAKAVWRLIERRGVASVTIRDIAAEAGVSAGILSHYFADKSAIMDYALRRAHAEVFDFVENTDAHGLAALREYLAACLPLDEGRMQLAIIEVSFWGLAIGDEVLSAAVTDEFQSWKSRVLDLIADAVHRQELRPSAMKNAALVDRLRLIMDGVTFRAASGESLSSSDQLALLDWAIADFLVDSDAVAERAPVRRAS